MEDTGEGEAAGEDACLLQAMLRAAPSEASVGRSRKRVPALLVVLTPFPGEERVRLGAVGFSLGGEAMCRSRVP